MIDISADLVVKKAGGKWGLYKISTKELIKEAFDYTHACQLLRTYREWQ